MIPVRDVIPSRTTPWVTIALVLVNIFIFLLQLRLPDEADWELLRRYGLVPAEFPVFALVTSQFVHNSVLHVASNVLVLWIFGENVEDRMGHDRFLVFYLLCGAAAAALLAAADSTSVNPIVGASGAIAGVIAAYLFMFPSSRIHVLAWLVYRFELVEMPAVILIALWFMVQVLADLGRAYMDLSEGGTLYLLHVGGFATGAILFRVFRRRERITPEWWLDRT